MKGHRPVSGSFFGIRFILSEPHTFDLSRLLSAEGEFFSWRFFGGDSPTYDERSGQLQFLLRFFRKPGLYARRPFGNTTARELRLRRDGGRLFRRFEFRPS
jgi:hypothetical protein